MTTTTIPARAAWSATVRAGEHLTLTDLHGNQAVDFLVYDAHDTAVRYSAPDTIQAAWRHLPHHRQRADVERAHP